MATRTWDEAVPADSEPLKDGASRIRDLKVDIRERARQGGINWGDNTTDDGKICVGVDGSSCATIYKSDKSTAALQVSDSEVKPGSGVVFRTNANKPVTYQRRALIWTVPYELDFTGTDGINFLPLPCPVASEGEYGSSVNVELVEFRIAVRVASSSTTTLKVDLKRCAAANAPVDANFSSILTAPLELPASANEAYTTSFTSVTPEYNDKFIIEITQADSADPCEYLTAMLVMRW